MVNDPVTILLEEYRALYGLLSVRMNALEHRALLAWGLVIGFWGAFETLASVARVSVLLGVPILTPLLLYTTISHAQSSEDAFRRLEEIEHEVNRLTGSALLQFQSRHPSRHKATGGRSGYSAVQMMTGALVVLLLSCAIAAWKGDSGAVMSLPYLIVIELALVFMTHRLSAYRRYRYVKPASDAA